VYKEPLHITQNTQNEALSLVYMSMDYIKYLIALTFYCIFVFYWHEWKLVFHILLIIYIIAVINRKYRLIYILIGFKEMKLLRSQL